MPPRTHVKVVLARLVPRATTRVHGASLPQLCLVVVQYVPVSVHARQSLGVSTAGLRVSVSGAVSHPSLPRPTTVRFLNLLSAKPESDQLVMLALHSVLEPRINFRMIQTTFGFT